MCEWEAVLSFFNGVGLVPHNAYKSRCRMTQSTLMLWPVYVGKLTVSTMEANGGEHERHGCNQGIHDFHRDARKVLGSEPALDKNMKRSLEAQANKQAASLPTPQDLCITCDRFTI
jgi:hypothetical protein